MDSLRASQTASARREASLPLSAPSPSPSPSPTRPSRLRRAARLGATLLQPFAVVAPDGRYSLGKLLALDRFRHTANRRRVAAVLLLSPLPCLLLVLLLECIPLADPALGWRRSGAYQLRAAGAQVVMSVASLYERHEHLPELRVTWTRALLYGLTITASTLATNVAIMVSTDVFPVPFSQFTAFLPNAVVAKLLALLLDRDAAPSTHVSKRERERRVQTVNGLQIAQTLPLVAYPVYAAAFSQLGARQQLCFSLVLVAMRLAVRVLQWRVARGDQDLMGAILAASGHLFHVLFTLACLQNAKSAHALALMLAFSAAQALVTARLLARGLRHAERAVADRDALASALQWIRDDAFVRALDRLYPTIVTSTFHGYQSDRLRAVCSRARPPIERELAVEPEPAGARVFRCCGRDRVRPTLFLTPTGPQCELLRVRAAGDGLATGERAGAAVDPSELALVADVCALLHVSEAALLRSYVTVMLILVYGVYLTVVFWLPNTRFLLSMQTITTFQDVQETLERHALVLLAELAFAAVYVALLRRRLALSGATLLAFVLSTQATLIQTKFVANPIFIFGFSLRHTGNEAILRL